MSPPSTRCSPPPARCAAGSTSNDRSPTRSSSTASTWPSRRRPAATSRSRRWIVVRDPARKEALAELYRDAGGDWIVERPTGWRHRPPRGGGHAVGRPPRPAPRRGARHRHPDDLGQPRRQRPAGLFDSVIQAAWSFCLALRARGLGSAWVDRHAAGKAPRWRSSSASPRASPRSPCSRSPTRRATDFSRAPRRPARDDHLLRQLGHTSRSGRRRSCVRRRARGGRRGRHRRPAAPCGRWSPTSTCPPASARSSSGRCGRARARGVGAEFVGRNQHPAVGEWSIPCFVDAREEGRSFGWCTSDPDEPGAHWRFDLEPSAGRTRLRFSYVIGPGRSGTTMAIEANPGKEARVLRRRLDEVRANMQRTVDGIKELAEADGG